MQCLRDVSGYWEGEEELTFVEPPRSTMLSAGLTKPDLGQLQNVQGPVQNENEGCLHLVQNLLRISGWWQQSIQPSIRPFWVGGLTWLRSCPLQKPASGEIESCYYPGTVGSGDKTKAYSVMIWCCMFGEDGMGCYESKDSFRSHTRISISLFSFSLKHFLKGFFFFLAVLYLYWSVWSSLYLRCSGFSVQWLLLWSAGALGLQWLWPAISVAPRRVGSSWIGDRTCVSRNGRRILNHWTTKEALAWNIFKISPAWEFPGSPVVRTRCFHCCSPGWVHGGGTK